jgi:hypothetical protein
MKTIIRFILGAIFILSGTAKAVDTQAFIGLIQGYDIGFLANAAIIIPPLEIILGLFLWFNIETKTSALIMIISTLFFTAIFLDVLLTKGIEDCGCFGSIKFLQMPPWGTVLRNVLIIAGSYFLYRFPPGETLKYRNYKFAAIAFVGLIAFTTSSISYSTPLISKKAINNQDLTGQDVSATFLKKFKNFDPKKRYAVFMYSPTCFHCWDATANVKSLAESHFVDETIAFAPSELMKEQLTYEAALKPNYKIFFISSKMFYEITTSTPVLMIIQNNKIISYDTSGMIKSGYTIMNFARKK